jgi:hypothetical protein
MPALHLHSVANPKMTEVVLHQNVEAPKRGRLPPEIVAVILEWVTRRVDLQLSRV